MAGRASRRAAMAATYDSDSDDEPMGGNYRGNRGKSAAAASSASAAAAANPVTPALSGKEKSTKRNEIIEDDSPPPTPKKGKQQQPQHPPPSQQQPSSGRISPLLPSRRALAASSSPAPPPQEDELEDEEEDEEDEDGNRKPAVEEGPGWGWVSAKFFQQDERILERWSIIADEGEIPDPNEADLEEVREFRNYLGKNNAKNVRSGIAFEQRSDVWELLSGSRIYGGRLENPINYYKSLVKQSHLIPPKLKKDIRADIPRTMQEHAKFKTKKAQDELNRILSAYCVRNPTIGYCQSMSHVVGFLMMYYGEESSFWFLCSLLDNFLPSEFYSPSLLGVRTETEVFNRLVSEKMNKLYKHLIKYDIDLRVVSLKWFMCIYLLTFPLEVTARIWDCFLLEGISILFNIGLALLDINKNALLDLNETSLLLEHLQQMGSAVTDADILIKKAYNSFGLKEKEINKLREKAKPQLEKEYVSQLQMMEERREKEEKLRKKAEINRIKQEKAEELALESPGTNVIKIPHKVGGLAGFFSTHSRPRNVILKLFHVRPLKKNKKENGNNIQADSSGRGNDGGASHGGAGDEDEQYNKLNGLGSSVISTNGGGVPTLPGESWRIEWEPSSKKSLQIRTFYLNECQLIIGITHGVFGINNKIREIYKNNDYLCMSILTPAAPNIGRNETSLDIVFNNWFDMESWLKVLKRSNVLSIRYNNVIPFPDSKKLAKAKKEAEAAAAAAAAAANLNGPAASSNAAAAAVGGVPTIAASIVSPSPANASSIVGSNIDEEDEDDMGSGGKSRSRREMNKTTGKSNNTSTPAATNNNTATIAATGTKGKKGILASEWHEEDEEMDVDAPVPKSKKKMMKISKDQEEADQLDVRDF
jgi:hypothetical protein